MRVMLYEAATVKWQQLLNPNLLAGPREQSGTPFICIHQHWAMSGSYFTAGWLTIDHLDDQFWLVLVNMCSHGELWDSLTVSSRLKMFSGASHGKTNAMRGDVPQQNKVSHPDSGGTLKKTKQKRASPYILTKCSNNVILFLSKHFSSLPPSLSPLGWSLRFPDFISTFQSIFWMCVSVTSLLVPCCLEERTRAHTHSSRSWCRRTHMVTPHTPCRRWTIYSVPAG